MFKRISLLLLLMVLLVGLCACSSGGNDVSKAYDEALNAMKQGRYAEAADKLSGISFYQDSFQLSVYCRAHAKAAEGDYAFAVAELRKLGAYRDSDLCAAYFEACRTEADADSPAGRVYAAELFDREIINGFRDSNARAESIRSKLYEEGVKAQEAESWGEASEIFSALQDYLDSTIRSYYTSGRGYELQGGENVLSYARAARTFAMANDFLDSVERLEMNTATVYKKADEFIAAEDFDSAEELYNALGAQCDKKKYTELQEAREKAAEAARQRKIAEADKLVQAKKYVEAKELYLEASEPEKANEALYLKAADLDENGKPEEAAAQYREIIEYKDSREKHYLLGNQQKKSDPEMASRILLSDREYPGAEEDLYEIALKATEEERYPLSISIYSEFIGKRDCQLRMMNDLYLYGLQLLEKENPEQAATVFDRLKGVGAADVHANVARYAAAEALESKGSYEAAASAFDLVSSYADASDRADNCRYKLATEKKKNGRYLEAAEIFASLGDREDSAEQEKDCRYLQAEVYVQQKNWSKAIALYEALNDYSESRTRCAECYRQLGEQQLQTGEAENAYKSFKSAGDEKGQARAAFAAGEAQTADMNLEEALKWYKLAPDLPETEERTAMIAQSLLNMEEDNLSEQYASVVADSEKAQPVLYALALRSLERKDEEAAMRQMKKAGDNADASERFKAIINDRVEKLVAEEKYDDAIFLCNTYGEQAQADQIAKVKAQKAEEEKQKALEAEEAERSAKAAEAEQLLKEGKYEEAAAVYSAIGQTELAEKALADKEAAEEAERAAEEAARLEAENAEKEKIRARLDEAAGKLAEGNYDEALQIYQELNDQEMVNEVIYQKAAVLGQPDLYLTILEYKDSRELHYLAGKALMDTEPEKAYRIIAEDIGYSDAQSVLYELADRESTAGHYSLASSIFMLLADQPMNPADPKPDCSMRAFQNMYQYGLSLKEQGEFELAADIFEQMPDLNSAQKHAKESYYAVAEKLEAGGKYTQAAKSFEALGDFSDAQNRAKKNRYTAAIKLLEEGHYAQAEEELSALGDYEDAQQQIVRCRYLTAKQLMDEKKYAEAGQAFSQLGAFEDAETLQMECRYLEACGLRENKQYEKAIDCFREIEQYKDSAEQINACYTTLGDLKTQEAESLLNTGNTIQATEVYQTAYELYKEAENSEKTDVAAYLTGACYQKLNNLGQAFDWYEKSGEAGKNQMIEIAQYALITEQYDTAEELQKRIDAVESRKNVYDLADRKLAEGNIDEAIRLFDEAGDFADAKARHDKLLYQKAEELSAKGEFEAASETYKLIPDYRDADEKKNANLYSYADMLTNQHDYFGAYAIFTALGNYSDAESRAVALQSKLFKVDDIVRLGHYEQDNNINNGPEEIEWIVLDIDEANHKALLLSRYGLEAMPYNTESTDITWEKCTLRAWLNGEFLNKAFSAKEQSAILKTKVDNSKSQGYSKWKTDGGNNTEDRIFLLSYTEANQYLGITDDNKNNIKSRVEPTAYALVRGAWRSDTSKTKDGVAAGCWWLRSPGNKQNVTAYVFFDGSLFFRNVDNATSVIRPAFWLDLESGIF